MTKIERNPWRVLISGQPTDWIEEASCADISAPEIFFPERGEDKMQAQETCNACPVKRECLQWALRNREQWGVWGGAGYEERRAISGLEDREAAIAAHFAQLAVRKCKTCEESKPLAKFYSRRRRCIECMREAAYAA